MIAGIAAMAFFSVAQHQGWAVYSGRGQQLASSGGGGPGSGFNRSSSISHK